MATLPKYLNIKNFHNPGGSAVQTSIIIKNYMIRYDQYISRNIKIDTYKDGKSIVFVLRIPSEKNFKYKTSIFYDVIIEFYPVSSIEGIEDEKRFVDYGMRVYSNCPTFTFMFTNVYHKMNSLYKKVEESLYSEKALSDPPSETNPYKLVGIEKSIWYSLRKIFETTKYQKSKVNDIAIDLSKKNPEFKFPGDLFENIMSQNDKLAEIHDVEKRRLPKKLKATTKREFRIDGKVVGVENRTAGKKSNLESIVESNLKTNKLASSIGKSKLQAKGFASKLKREDED